MNTVEKRGKRKEYERSREYIGCRDIKECTNGVKSGALTLNSPKN